MDSFTKPSMIDLHMHLIPGADDGAADLPMALEMLGRAQRQGIGEIFATPHNDAFHCPEREILPNYRILKDAAAEAYPDIKLHLGCEVYCQMQDMPQILESLGSGLYPTMNGTRYVLAEFPQWVLPENTTPCLEALIHAGYRPIVAHAERYPNLQGNVTLVKQFRDMGARIQVNTYSLYDEKDAAIRAWARQLVLFQKADFLGTDAHRTSHRPPIAENGLAWIWQNCGKAYACKLIRDNALTHLLG